LKSAVFGKNSLAMFQEGVLRMASARDVAFSALMLTLKKLLYPRRREEEKV